MRFTDLFIRRPVLATVINLFILLIGWFSFNSMNVRQFPRSESAVVTVSTMYIGASADLVAGFITTPLEREIASADGIDFITSSSGPNMSMITVQLKLNYDPNDALTQITSKVNKVRNDLPQGSEEPSIDLTVGDSTAAMYLAFGSEDLDSNQITDYLTRVVQPKLSAVSGVQSAEILGARTFAMRIWLDPDLMTSRDITPSQVRSALASNNYLAAVGSTKGSMIKVNLNARTDLQTEEGFRNLIVKKEGDRIVRLGDIAQITLGAENYDSSVRFSNMNATFIGVSTLPTANSLDVIRDVRAVLPALESQFPEGMTMTIPYDSTEYINDAITEVEHTLIEAIAIVIIVIFLFLGSARSVMIPIIAIPLSLMGAGFLMMSMGFTINILTLLAMVLAIGLVVDDAIVVVENIHRHIEEGLSPLDASLKGAHELVGPIIAMTITLAAVYAPIGFQTGLTGSLFKEFAFTLASAVIVSGVVALTLTPMLCSRILKADTGKKGFAHFLDILFEKLQKRYEHFLHSALRYRPVVYIFALIMLFIIVPLFMFTQQELAPDEDKGMIMMMSSGAPNATLEQTLIYSDEIVGMLQSFPETEDVFQINGMSGTNSAFTGMRLSTWSERERSSMDLLPMIQGGLGSIAGLKTAAFLPPALPGTGGGLPVQFVVTSTDPPERLKDVSDALFMKAMTSGKFIYGDNDLKFDQPLVDIDIDREKAAALGVNMQTIGADLGSMLGGGYVNRFSVQGRSYKVIPQVSRKQRLNADQLLDYNVSGTDDKLIPVSSFATIREKVGPQQIKRFQQLNAATLSFLPAPGVTQADALNFLNDAAKTTFPDGYVADYAGGSRQFVQEGSSLLISFLLAMVVIYLVLAGQFESFRDPLIIMISIPLSITGAMIFLFLGFATLNIYTQVGLITLVGLITKHGILIVQFANQMQDQGMSKRAALEHAAGVRLRPILMTTGAMVLGVLPLVMATGAGATSRFSIGLVIASGMAIGTVFTLFVVPAFYLLIGKDRKNTGTEIA